MCGSVGNGVSIIFCCKQKTAYEMRISDWRSDVCSSDLVARQRAELADGSQVVQPAAGHGGAVQQHLVQGQHTAALGDDALDQRLGFGMEIGRASWWDRACQYV